jgi:branched-chain amino acid transport system substrate-binding protein
MVQAIELAVDEANTFAAASGAGFELSIMDDNGSEQVAKDVARTFAEDKDVAAVIGHYNSNVTLAAAPIYAEADLPMIAPIVSNAKLTESGWTNVFRFTNRDDATATAIAEYLVDKRGKRRAIVVVTDTVYGNSMSQQFSRAFERWGGSVLNTHSVREGATDFRELVRLFPADMDVIFYGGTFEGAPLLRDVRDAGMPQLFAAGDGCWDIGNFLTPAGSYAEVDEGVLVLSACPELGTVSGSAEFASRFQARFGPIRNYAVNSYDAAALVIERLRLAEHDRRGLVERRSAVQSIRQAARRGIAYNDPVRWDDKGDNVATVTALHVVKDGTFRQVAVLPVTRSIR